MFNIGSKQRSNRIKKRKNRQSFSAAEDEVLRELVRKNGEANWTLISKQMPGRNPRQCRDRWRSYLRPALVNTQWTNDEDRLLLQKYDEFGPKWAMIGKFLVGRSDVAMRNRWKLLTQNGQAQCIQQFPMQQIVLQQPMNLQIVPGDNQKRRSEEKLMVNDEEEQKRSSTVSNSSSGNVSDGNGKGSSDKSNSSSSAESSADTSAVQEKQVTTQQDLEAFFNSLTKSPVLRNAPKYKL